MALVVDAVVIKRLLEDRTDSWGSSIASTFSAVAPENPRADALPFELPGVALPHIEAADSSFG